MRSPLAASLLSLFLAAPLPAATLLHRYTFDSAVTDSVGSEHGTLLGGATVTGSALSVNGGHAQFNAHLIPTSGSYAVTLFAKFTSNPTGITEMISQGSSGGPGFYIGTAGNSTMRVTDSWGSTPIQFINDGAFHHYAMSVDASNNLTSFYIDGVLKGTHSAISTTTGGSHTRLGRQFAPYDEFFPGLLDDVQIYSGSLTSSEVAALLPEPSSLLAACGLALPLAMRRRLAR